MTALPVARLVGGLLAGLCLVTLVGCASVKLDATSASPLVLERLRGSNLQPIQAGQFALAPGKPPEMDRTLSGLRGNSLTPAKGSFAGLLKDTLIVEMTAAGLYDAKAPVVVEADLTDSKVDAAIGTGSGRLAARFRVQRAGQKVYDKELAVDATWESSFVGAVAIPAAMNQYQALYKSLVLKLIDDPDFRRAAGR